MTTDDLAASGGSVGGSHTYMAAGVYAPRIDVTDSAGGKGGSFYMYIVVYKASAGYVSGNGSIRSPAGAYYADKTLAGTANFGFTFQYKNGATTLTGRTKLVFWVADFQFVSSSYEWLVVADHKARYKGAGTVNGAGNYGFLLSAIDAALTTDTSDVDRFRIKIWDKDKGDAIVYDSELGRKDDVDPTNITSGVIEIKKQRGAHTRFDRIQLELGRTTEESFTGAPLSRLPQARHLALCDTVAAT